MDDSINAYNDKKKLEILGEIVNVGNAKTKFKGLKIQEGFFNLVETTRSLLHIILVTLMMTP
jgi:hypothetical protein